MTAPRRPPWRPTRALYATVPMLYGTWTATLRARELGPGAYTSGSMTAYGTADNAREYARTERVPLIDWRTAAERHPLRLPRTHPIGQYAAHTADAVPLDEYLAECRSCGATVTRYDLDADPEPCPACQDGLIRPEADDANRWRCDACQYHQDDQPEDEA